MVKTRAHNRKKPGLFVQQYPISDPIMPSQPPDLETEKENQRAVLTSAVSNGKRFFLPGVNHRTATARRLRDLCEIVMEDRGGPDHLSECEKQLSRRVATMSLACEIREAQFVETGELDAAEYVNLATALGRIMQKLGIKRAKRDVTIPHLHDYVREQR